MSDFNKLKEKLTNLGNKIKEELDSLQEAKAQIVRTDKSSRGSPKNERRTSSGKKKKKAAKESENTEEIEVYLREVCGELERLIISRMTFEDIAGKVRLFGTDIEGHHKASEASLAALESARNASLVGGGVIAILCMVGGGAVVAQAASIFAIGLFAAGASVGCALAVGGCIGAGLRKKVLEEHCVSLDALCKEAGSSYDDLRRNAQDLSSLKAAVEQEIKQLESLLNSGGALMSEPEPLRPGARAAYFVTHARATRKGLEKGFTKAKEAQEEAMKEIAERMSKLSVATSFISAFTGGVLAVLVSTAESMSVTKAMLFIGVCALVAGALILVFSHMMNKDAEEL